MRSKNNTVLAFLLLFGLLCNAQSYSFKNISIEQGLNQGYIYGIIENSDGSLTISTGKGNVIYTGTSFKNVQINGLENDDFISSSFTDYAGNTWMGSFSGQIFKKSNEKKFLSVYRSKSTIVGFCDNKNGSVLALTKGKGIVLFSGNRFENICENCLQEPITSAAFLSKNEILLGSKEGLYTYSISNKQLKKSSALPNIEINCILNGKNKNVFYVGSKNNGLFILETDRDLNIKLNKNIALKEGLNNQDVRSIVEDKNQKVWIASTEDEVYSIDTKNNYALKAFGKEAGILPNGFIKIMFIDRDGNLWMGSYGNGIYRLDIDPFEHISIQSNSNDNNVNALTSDNRGNFWFATNSGILEKNFKNGQQKALDFGQGNSIIKVTSLLCDESKSELWAGTAENGLYIFDLKTGLQKVLKDKPDLKGNTINSICKDNSGSIWICTTLSGVYKYDGNFEQYSTQNGLGHNYIYQAFADKSGRIWFATHANSMHYFEKGMLYESTMKNGTGTYDFNAFCEDKNGNIWTATYGNGFANISTQPNIVVNNKNGLPSNYCYGIICDRDNNLWIPQKNSLTRYNPIKQSIKTFFGKDIFGDNQFNINAVHLDAEGNSWFGTDKGVIKFVYTSYEANKIEAKPKITNFRVFNENKDLSAYITLPYSSYSVTFEFEALSLRKSEEVLYKYRLYGRDKIWSVPSSLNFVNYSNLADGNYTFELLACNNDGLWNSEPVKISFTINPPLWKNWKFWTFIFTLFVILIVVYVNLRAKQLKRQRDELKRMVAKKTSELSHEKILVESQNKIIRAKNKDIQDSINYAQKIQDAILPSIKDLKNILTDVFILYMPREIVSGDFYWFTQQDDSIIIAAADCTGHGVPGALMSMIGNALLRETILLHGINNPKQILYALDDGIISTLNQGGIEKERKDGMAISICKILPKQKEIQFAASQQSMIYIGAHGSKEIKGEFFSIGDYEVDDKIFENHNIQYEKGDMIYLFSDGYLDQFGGPENRKFMKKRFLELLGEISHMEGSFQKSALEKNIASWKGDKSQTDDIMVIGIRL